MDDKTESLKLLFKRFLISIPFFAISTLMFLSMSAISLLAVFPLIPPAYLLAEPLSRLVSNPFGSIFNPKPKNRQISLMFSIPEAQIMEGRYKEALDSLWKLKARDPKRLEVYIRIMNIAVNRMREIDVARNAFKEGLRNLKDLEDKKILAFEYRRLRILFRETDNNA